MINNVNKAIIRSKTKLKNDKIRNIRNNSLKDTTPQTFAKY